MKLQHTLLPARVKGIMRERERKKKKQVDLFQKQKWKNPKQTTCQVNLNLTKTVPHDQAGFTPDSVLQGHAQES